jgi:polyisoprenoid-binding protein YceI
MKKSVLFLALSFVVFNIQSQQYYTKTGKIKFSSHTDIEDIKAENRKVVSVLDSKTGALEFSLLMKGFDFPNDLMEKHFNESYAESTKYPKAVFKGKVTDISTVDFTKDGTYKVNYTGKLTIKDVTKDISGTATIVIKGGKITATSSFKLRPKEYNFKIPAAVAGNIADEVTVDITMDYKKK